MGFDVVSLLQAEFPRALCPRCGCITSQWKDYAYSEPQRNRSCTVCGQKWHMYSPGHWISFFEHSSSAVIMKDPVEQAKSLAEVVSRFSSRPSLEALFGLLARAQHFVHFATWNISDSMLGALTMLATRVKVRGIVWQMDTRQSEVLKMFEQEVKNLDVLVCGDKSNWSAPHFKLLVFDGLVAIDGSTNLSHNAWFKVADDDERVRFITDLEEIRELNNRYFSKRFRTKDGWYGSDALDDEVPF